MKKVLKKPTIEVMYVVPEGAILGPSTGGEVESVNKDGGSPGILARNAGTFTPTPSADGFGD